MTITPQQDILVALTLALFCAVLFFYSLTPKPPRNP